MNANKSTSSVNWIEIQEGGYFVYKTRFCLLWVQVRRDDWGYWEINYEPLGIWSKIKDLRLDASLQEAQLRAISLVNTQLQILAEASRDLLAQYQEEICSPIKVQYH